MLPLDIADNLFSYDFSMLYIGEDGTYLGNSELQRRLFEKLKVIDASQAFQVYKRFPEEIRAMFKNTFFDRITIEENKQKILNGIKEKGRIKGHLYRELSEDYAVKYIYEHQDSLFWKAVLQAIEKNPLQRMIHPVGVEDYKAGPRYVANFVPCVILMGETLADIGLSMEQALANPTILAILAAITAVLSLFTNLYVAWSSNNLLSRYALTSGILMLLMVLMTDISDSLYLNAVGDFGSVGTFIAALFPLLFPALELGFNWMQRPHVSADIMLLQCIGSLLVVNFHAFVFFIKEAGWLEDINQRMFDAYEPDPSRLLTGSVANSNQQNYIVMGLLLLTMFITMVHTFEYATIYRIHHISTRIHLGDFEE